MSVIQKVASLSWKFITLPPKLAFGSKKRALVSGPALGALGYYGRDFFISKATAGFNGIHSFLEDAASGQIPLESMGESIGDGLTEGWNFATKAAGLSYVQLGLCMAGGTLGALGLAWLGGHGARKQAKIDKKNLESAKTQLTQLDNNLTYRQTQLARIKGDLSSLGKGLIKRGSEEAYLDRSCATMRDLQGQVKEFLEKEEGASQPLNDLSADIETVEKLLIDKNFADGSKKLLELCDEGSVMNGLCTLFDGKIKRIKESRDMYANAINMFESQLHGKRG